MIRLGEVIKKHRILLKPHFQDKVLKIDLNFFKKKLIFYRIKQEVEKSASQGSELF